MPRFLSVLCLVIFSLSAKNILHITSTDATYSLEFQKIAKEFNYALTTWYVPDLPPQFLDGTSGGLALYCLSHERAERIWNLHQKTFETFDLICVSGHAPLARIFLQNNWQKPLLIWVAGPFDYEDLSGCDGNFPDLEYYELFALSRTMPNVQIVSASPFAISYAASKGIDLGDRVLPPIGIGTRPLFTKQSSSFYIPPRYNEVSCINVAKLLQDFKISTTCTHIAESMDLCSFRGIVHLPCGYTSAGLFQHLALGIIYCLPSKNFFEQLISTAPGYYHEHPSFLLKENRYDLSDWYHPEHADWFIYFDSWDDLAEKLKTTNFRAKKEKLLSSIISYQKEVRAGWAELFQDLFQE
ncbi:MAG: hypothetical protein KGI80_01615 [Verrucomicrobiota bacterium]|nr:hypothetical protein [Verrucomicrobiota bacterium]